MSFIIILFNLKIKIFFPMCQTDIVSRVTVTSNTPQSLVPIFFIFLNLTSTFLKIEQFHLSSC